MSDSSSASSTVHELRAVWSGNLLVSVRGGAVGLNFTKKKARALLGFILDVTRINVAC